MFVLSVGRKMIRRRRMEPVVLFVAWRYSSARGKGQGEEKRRDKSLTE
jgi:hypothetical protein